MTNKAIQCCFNVILHHKQLAIKPPTPQEVSACLCCFSLDIDADVSLKALSVVSHDGSVLWVPQARLRVPCSEGGSRDGYNGLCQFKFGSWTYDGFKLDLDFFEDLEEIDVTDYKGEYKVVSAKAVKHVKYYPCCKEPYPDITFSLKLKRP